MRKVFLVFAISMFLMSLNGYSKESACQQFQTITSKNEVGQQVLNDSTTQISETSLFDKNETQSNDGRKRGMAVAGFVVSLVGLLLLPALFGILGVIFSSIGLAKAIKNPDTHKAKGLAIAGLSISVIDIIWWLLVLGSL